MPIYVITLWLFKIANMFYGDCVLLHTYIVVCIYMYVLQVIYFIIYIIHRVILKLAAQSQGVIVSNKHYNNLWEEVEEWREIIEKR